MRRVSAAVMVSMLLVSCDGGSFIVFNTSPPNPFSPPSVQTLPADNIAFHGGGLVGTVNSNGSATTVHFEYAGHPDLSFPFPGGIPFVVGADGRVAFRLDGLASGTTYYYRIVANNAGGWASGSIMNFTTPVDAVSAWARSYGRYGSSVSDSLGAVQATNEGGIIAAGYTVNPADGNGNAWVFLADGGGGVKWQKAYGGPGWDVARSIVETSDGGYAVAGTYDTSTNPAIVSSEVWVLRLNADGTVRWQKRYGLGVAATILQAADGGFVVAGGTWASGAGGEDFLVLKLNADGSVQWQKTFGGSGDEEAQTVERSGDGGFVVGGWSDSFGSDGDDVWILKLDPGGLPVWQKRYDGGQGDKLHSLRATADGGFAFTGYTEVSGGVEVLFGRIAGDGSLAWWKAMEGDWVEGRSVLQASDGGFVLAGCMRCSLAPIGFAAGFAGDGTLQWQKSYGYTRVFNSIGETADGLILGGSFERGFMDWDAQLFKIGRDGSVPPLDTDSALVPLAVAASVHDTPGSASDRIAAAVDTAANESPTTATTLQQAP